MDQVEKVVHKIETGDRFAGLVGIKIEEARPGYSRVSLKVQDKHLNSVDITHGGVIFTLCDMAFAIASNSHDRISLALNMSINFVKATGIGSVLTAEATEDKLTNRTGLYRLVVKDEAEELVAVAEGLAYRKNKKLE